MRPFVFLPCAGCCAEGPAVSPAQGTVLCETTLVGKEMLLSALGTRTAVPSCTPSCFYYWSCYLLSTLSG